MKVSDSTLSQRVLVVDDSKAMRDTICQLIATLNVVAIPAENAKDAFKIFTSQPVDLLITDLNMPQLSGLDLIKVIREHSIGTTLPIILLSGQLNDEIKVQASHYGIDALLSKPFLTRELISIILTQLNANRGRL